MNAIQRVVWKSESRAGRVFDTVGYGDAYPVTAGGRLFTTVILLCGMGIVAVPAGLVATALTRAGRTDDSAKAERPASPRRFD